MKSVTALLVAAVLLASPVAAATDTQSFGSRVLVTGDSVGVVRQVAGTPDRIVPLHNRFGAVVGERWEYYRDSGTIMVVIQGGRVVAIERE